uniref:Uncharacterized protein n=1 Tax=Oryza meridionalis TaxID=40149 RepID=A0A0E0DT39_9ORYZ
MALPHPRTPRTRHQIREQRHCGDIKNIREQQSAAIARSLRDQRAGRRRINRKQEKRKGEESIGSGAASSRKNARTGLADAKKQRS